MADDEKKAGAEAPSKGGGKTPMVVGAIMLIEAVLVYVVVTMTGGPSAAEASDLQGQEIAEAETPVEIPLYESRIQNMQTGRVWEWHVEIVLQVRQKNADYVNRTLERRHAEINEGVAKIFRRAQDRHLREPGLETITLQLKAYVDEVFGVDDTDGRPRVERVLIPTCKGFLPNA